MRNIQHFGCLAFACFVVLFVLTLPFPYAFLFDVGGFLSQATEPVVGYIARQVLGLYTPYAANIVSDATGMYVLVLLCICISIIASGLYLTIWPQSIITSASKYYFRAFISYYLALHLLKYGFDKVFKHQFYFPEPNTLYTPVGYLSKSMLYWASIGSSYGYSMFLGIVEVAVAILLCFRRTRTLGGIIALVVMVQVLAVNFGFDISVKLFALFLTVLAWVIAFPGLKILYRTLVQELAVEFTSWKPRYGSSVRLRLLYAVGKSLIICVLLFESLFSYFKSWSFNGDVAPRPLLYGAYAVELQSPSMDIKRIFIHSRGYLIVQDHKEILEDYELMQDDGHTLVVQRKGTRSVLHYTFVRADSSLTLHGNLGGKPVEIYAKMLDISRLPLRKDSFSWTIDSYIKE